MDTQDKKEKLYREKACIDCGLVVRMHIRSKRCRACQDAADNRNEQAYRKARAAGNIRPIGSVDLCQKCGMEYTVCSGAQRYCPDCAGDAVAENVRALARGRYAKAYATPEAKEARQEKRRTDWQGVRYCLECGAAFTPAHPRQVCCSNGCREQRRKAITAASDLKRRPERLEKLKQERREKHDD